MGFGYIPDGSDRRDGGRLWKIPCSNGLCAMNIWDSKNREMLIEITGPCGKKHQMNASEAKALGTWLLNFAHEFRLEEKSDLMTDLKALLRKHGGE